jgi:hypothetical protein
LPSQSIRLYALFGAKPAASIRWSWSSNQASERHARPASSVARSSPGRW